MFDSEIKGIALLIKQPAHSSEGTELCYQKKHCAFPGILKSRIRALQCINEK